MTFKFINIYLLIFYDVKKERDEISPTILIEKALLIGCLKILIRFPKIGESQHMRPRVTELLIPLPLHNDVYISLKNHC